MRHLRLSFVLLSGLWLALYGTPAIAQDWQDQGSIKSREFRKEIREDGKVIATEFFTLEYQVSISIKRDPGLIGTLLMCYHVCQGKKHKDHESCDYSCDDRCTKPHKTTINGVYTPLRDQMAAATRAANALAIKGGGTVSPNDWSQRVSSALAAFKNECKKKKNWDMPHSPTPCSMQEWCVGYTFAEFSVRGTMTKVGYRMSMGQRTPINEVVGTHEQVVATGQIPEDEPIRKENSTICFCKGVSEEEKDTYQQLLDSLFPDYSDEELLELLFGYGGFSVFDEIGNPLDRGLFDWQATSDNMNNCDLTVTNKSGTTAIFILSTGTLFYPDDPSVQIMVALSRPRLVIPAWSTATLRVNMAPGDVLGVQGKERFRWACTEMQKKEPNTKVKWKLKSPHDLGMKRLGDITNKSRFRGPWDQARVWIYTDKAPLSEVNKRMIPGVAPGRYAMLLRDVYKAAGVDFAEKGFSACLEPNLLDGVCVDEEALKWLVATMSAVKGRDLARYVSGNASKIAALATSDPEDGPNHVAWIAQTLLEQDDAELRMAATKLLMAVEKSKQGAVAAAGGTESLRTMLSSGKADQCEAALGVLEAYATEDGKALAGACAEGMPNEALKTRAFKLAGVDPSDPPFLPNA